MTLLVEAMRLIYCLALLISTLSLAIAETRFEKPVTLHDEHPFRVFRKDQGWKDRKEEIRTRILLGSGLLPLPEKTSLNPKRFGAVEREGFRVERVYFESFPGHFVTGSLFIPTGESATKALRDGKRPGVLCPHGHWTDGRFYDALNPAGDRGSRAQIAKGAERFWSASRNPIIARCVQLARMGCLVFVYDMIGYADSTQFADHRRGPRAEMNHPEIGKWGFVSPQATLRLQTNFGLQTWNSVRALDFLTTLPEVDSDRLLVTGASGGATQTMILSAIDERVDAAFPAVMVSTAMQGGCTCENSYYLRIDQGNIDIAAATAPRPLGLTAADDWTIELETKGHPDLQSLYGSLGVPQNYEAHFDIHFKHNFNHVSRVHLYQFVNRHFGLKETTPILEEDFEFLGREALSVWSDHPKPANYKSGPAHEKEVNRFWAEDSDSQWLKAREAAAKGDYSFIRSWVRPAWETILRSSAVKGKDFEFDLESKSPSEQSVTLSGKIVSGQDDDFVNATITYPKDWNGEVVIRLGEKGQNEEVGSSQAALICLDLYGQNDPDACNPPTTYSGKDGIAPDSWQRSPVYFYGYNDSVWVRRVHDVVAAIRMAEHHPDWNVKKITVSGNGPFASIALGARLICGNSIQELKADPANFRFSGIEDNWDDFMVPGAVKYGDIEGLQSAIQSLD